jgi:enoyl-CoA hydratase/carnithine racemase
MIKRLQRAFSTPAYENIIVQKLDGGVAQITLNRPKALNALCWALYKDI